MVFTLLTPPLARTIRTAYMFVLACLVCLPLHLQATESSAQSEVETFPELTVTDSRIHTDYSWLADSLGHRMGEVNRYPHDARRNGWEGKVVLRVTIGADGRLRDVIVQDSSGYEPLDQAAQEAVRQACPLPLQRQIHRPEVVIRLPVVYRMSP
ncbi:MAG: energy transducer TonB [Nitrospira sp.]|nr:energy transducer TonB [Nitrospira sp.]MCW5785612.1 energy transducer TonB [Nitrospirales bacterium]